MNRREDRAYTPFPATQWSLVARAVDVSPEVKRAALTELLKRYLPAMRSYLVNVRRVDPDRADDLLQGFLTSKVLEQDLIEQASATKGKFRTYLLTSLNNYIVSEVRKETAQKRRPGDMFSIDSEMEPAGSAPRADRAFDVEWARALLQQVQARMKAECERTDRADVWGIFLDRLLTPLLENAEPPSYDVLVKRYKLSSPTQASNLLMTAKRTFERVFRDVVREYAGDDADVEAEIADLHNILSR
jgi:DNA-directed RNA polymerase specialized sigma24 family protein